MAPRKVKEVMRLVKAFGSRQKQEEPGIDEEQTKQKRRRKVKEVMKHTLVKALGSRQKQEEPGRDEEQTKQKRRRKRAFGFTNPFEFPPCEYNQCLFRATQPFVVVGRAGVLPAYNKFAGGEMDPEALDTAITILTGALADDESLFARATSEGNLRPIHIALVKGFHSLTMPSGDEVGPHLNFDKVRQHEEMEDDSEISGYSIKCGGQSDPSSSARNRSSNEAAPQGEDDIKKAGRTDLRIFVNDKSPLKRKDIGKLKKIQVKPKKTVVVAESKFNEDIDGLFQAAGYGSHEVQRNLQNFHFSPMYFMVFAAKTWRYGIFEPHGSIELQDNKITAASVSGRS